jgi:carboxymethylenebutenolidase
MDRQIIDLYDNFTHGRINRRDFFDRLTAVAGSAAAATTIYNTLKPGYANAATIAEDDARLVPESVTVETPAGKLNCYLTRLKNKAKRPAVMVVHENRGLGPHPRDIARRLALEGFLVLAPDFLSPQGGTPTEDDKARDMHAKINLTEVDSQAVAAVRFMNKHAESTGKTGAVGFCWGGGVIDRLAINSGADLAAAVSYYGPIPANKDGVKNIAAPLLLHYASLDTFVNPAIPSWEEALKAAGKKYTIYMYEGVNHAFNNDTAGPRYNKEAADLAWSRTIAFFKENVGMPPPAA